MRVVAMNFDDFDGYDCGDDADETASLTRNQIKMWLDRK